MRDHGEKILVIRPASLSKEMFAQPERKRREKSAPRPRGRRLHSEVYEVLVGRAPTLPGVPRLVYTRMIVDEVLRLYPPV